MIERSDVILLLARLLTLGLMSIFSTAMSAFEHALVTWPRIPSEEEEAAAWSAIRMLRLLVRLAAAAPFLLLAAWNYTDPKSPELMTRCAQYYSLWDRYLQNPIFHHTGQKARAELALGDCRSGRYDEGLIVLEQLLRQGAFLIPGHEAATGAPRLSAHSDQEGGLPLLLKPSLRKSSKTARHGFARCNFRRLLMPLLLSC